MIRDEMSRRAFALDSRTSWVESTIQKGMVISIDNTPIGPGEYNPPLRPNLQRHISTPTLGKRNIVDMHHPFRSPISRNGIRSATPYSIANDISLNSMELEEPSVETVGSYLGHDDILKPKSSYGGKTKVTAIVIDRAIRELNPTRAAGPSHFPIYTKTEKRLLPVKIGNGERFSYNVKRKKKKPRKEPEIPFSKRPVSPWRQQKLEHKLMENAVHYGGVDAALSIASSLSAERSQSPPTFTSQIHARQALITKPKLGSRAARFGAPPKFDDTTYKRTKKPMPLNISPGVIDRSIKADLFLKFLTARREPRFKPKGMPSLVADKLKRHGISSAQPQGNQNNTYGDYLGN